MTRSEPARPRIGRHAWYVALALEAEADAWREATTLIAAQRARNVVGVRWARAVELALRDVLESPRAEVTP